MKATEMQALRQAVSDAHRYVGVLMILARKRQGVAFFPGDNWSFWCQVREVAQDDPEVAEAYNEYVRKGQRFHRALLGTRYEPLTALG